MILVGMLDSPYVRRCAVSMKLMGVPFEHKSLSVFRTFDQFRAVNPVVKAPTLVCADGAVLMDSTLILEYIESQVPESRRLMPAHGIDHREALRLTGLALAASEKCVQIFYEKTLRPEDKRHGPWLERVIGQANAAFGELERDMQRAEPWMQGAKLTAADVVVECSWRFSQHSVPDEVLSAKYPRLAQHCERAEALPEFASTPLD
jgi:glutathione S-transferase